uniref:Uncharacterized protein n=1 Tax=Anguilla anguilla TaxID=7936 RepID=A0A0E9RPW9_ANGAN
MKCLDIMFIIVNQNKGKGEVHFCHLRNKFPKCTLKVQYCSIWVLMSTFHKEKW